MSKETEDNLSFDPSAYFRLPSFNTEPVPESQMKDIKKNLDSLKLGENDFINTPSLTPKKSDSTRNEFNYGNLIPDDLLKRLDQSSPVKSQMSQTEDKRRLSDICLLNCEKEDDESLRQDKSLKCDSESLLNKQQNKVAGLFRKKSYRKEHSAEPMKAERTQNKNSSDFVKKTVHSNKRNFILKTEVLKPGDDREEENNQEDVTKTKNYVNNESESIRSPSISKKSLNRNDSSPIYSYFGGSSEYFSQAFLKNNPRNELSGQEEYENRQHQSYAYMQPQNPYSYTRSEEPQNHQQNHFMNNYGNFQPQKMYPANYYNPGEINMRPISMDNQKFDGMKNNFTPQKNNKLNRQPEDPEDYIVEMFGRRGWICEMCNNFNYETRVKCNRCCAAKTPKRNVKGKYCKAAEQGKDSSDKKGKKPFVERVGDWVCIRCKNLNFSFRVVCNRCQLSKNESEMLFKDYMSKLMNCVKLNEMMQMQMMNNPNNGNMMNHQSNLVNNSNININNNYFNNFSGFPDGQAQMGEASPKFFNESRNNLYTNNLMDNPFMKQTESTSENEDERFELYK